MAKIECCVSCGAIIPEGTQICPRCSIHPRTSADRIERKNTFRTIEVDGKIYIESRYYREVYGIHSEGFAIMKKNGLPFISKEKNTWINRQDFFDYHSGLLGNDSWKMKRA